MRTATNLSVDHETASLGEDYTEIQTVESLFQTLLHAVETARTKVHSARATATLLLMETGLADLRHDACLGSTLELARDAAVEARVVEIQPARIATSHLAEVIKVEAAE